MADTLEEIVNVTLTEQELEEGSFELITTDANTALVVKDIYIEENPDKLPALPVTLSVNGVRIGQFSDSATGGEIIGTDSTVEITSQSPAFPLAFQDFSFDTFSQVSPSVQTSNSFMVNTAEETGLKTNQITDVSGFVSASDFFLSGTEKFLSPNSTRLVHIQDPGTGVTALYVTSESETVFFKTTNFEPHAYDGQQFVYSMSSRNLVRVDITLDTPVQQTVVSNFIASSVVTNTSGRAKASVSRGINTAFFTFNGTTTDSVRGYRINTNQQWNMGLAMSTSAWLNRSGDTFGWLTHFNSETNRYDMVILKSGASRDIVGIFTASVNGAAVLEKEVTLPFPVPDNGNGRLLGRTLYYMDDNNRIIEVNLDDPENFRVITTITGIIPFNKRITAVSTSVPDAQTISSREYTILTELKIRATGVRSIR